MKIVNKCTTVVASHYYSVSVFELGPFRNPNSPGLHDTPLAAQAGWTPVMRCPLFMDVGHIQLQMQGSSGPPSLRDVRALSPAFKVPFP